MDQDDVDELSDIVQQRLRLHPSLYPFLTRNLHVRYGGSYEAYVRKPFLAKTLTACHKMTAPLNNPPAELFTSSEADNMRTAAEIVNHEFAKRQGVFGPKKDTQLLTEGLSESLIKDGYDLDEIQRILHSFDRNVTAGDFERAYRNVHVIKSCGFHHAQAFYICLQDMRRKGEKKVIIDLTARLYLSILKHNDNMNSDTPREKFLSDVRRYVEKADKVDFEARFLGQIGQNGVATLNTIRDNCIINCKSLLESENRGHKHYVSLALYAQREQFPKMEISSRSMEKIFKVVNRNDEKPVSLNRSTLDLPVGYNCFICESTKMPTETRPSAASVSNAQPSTLDANVETEAVADLNEWREGDVDNNDENDSYFPIEIRDKCLARFNVQRLIFVESKAKAEEHFRECHTSFTPSQLATLNGHYKLYFCSLCDPNDVEIAAACCTSHLSDHIRYI